VISAPLSVRGILNNLKGGENDKANRFTVILLLISFITLLSVLITAPAVLVCRYGMGFE
jgi:hypothetical protein